MGKCEDLTFNLKFLKDLQRLDHFYKLIKFTNRGTYRLIEREGDLEGEIFFHLSYDGYHQYDIKFKDGVLNSILYKREEEMLHPSVEFMRSINYSIANKYIKELEVYLCELERDINRNIRNYEDKDICNILPTLFNTMLTRKSGSLKTGDYNIEFKKTYIDKITKGNQTILYWENGKYIIFTDEIYKVELNAKLHQDGFMPVNDFKNKYEYLYNMSFWLYINDYDMKTKNIYHNHVPLFKSLNKLSYLLGNFIISFKKDHTLNKISYVEDVTNMNKIKIMYYGEYDFYYDDVLYNKLNTMIYKTYNSYKNDKSLESEFYLRQYNELKENTIKANEALPMIID